MDRYISLSLLALILVISYSEASIVTVTGSYQQPLELVCKDAATLSDKTVKWLKDKEPVEAKENVYEINAENQTLTIVKVGYKVLGLFTCLYNGTMEMSFDIKVLPFVTPYDKSRNVIQGDPLRLDCKAWGVPEPTITWFRDGTQLLPDASGKITLTEYPSAENDPIPKIANGTIRIVGMDYPDAGNYSCLVTSPILDGDKEPIVVNATLLVQVKDKYAALWPFLGICVEVAVLCTIILIYERRRAKRIEEEERQEEAAHLNANNEARPVAGGDELRQRK